MEKTFLKIALLLFILTVFLFEPPEVPSESYVPFPAIIQGNSFLPISSLYYPDAQVLRSLIEEWKPLIREVTAYNAVEAQTDSEPCIAYGGFDVCKALKYGKLIAASNEFEIGQRIYIPYLSAVYEIHDRMNDRYPYRIDLLFEDLEEAKQFGIQKLEIYPLTN